VENNNWRSIAFNMLPKAADLEREQRDKPIEKGRDWHYSRLQRWQDREKKQRHRRIEWMQKLYRQTRVENAAAAHDSTSPLDEAVASPLKEPAAPPATGATSKHQLSDHNLPLRAPDSAADQNLQAAEWLMRAKTIAAGAAHR
jgi:hypothetical protein